jgi:hypothetical protein
MVVVNTYQQLTNEIAKYKNPATLHPKYLFRGQSSCRWSLEPSFTRIVKKKNLNRIQTIQLEREAVNKFSISANILLPLEYTINLTLSRFKSPDGLGLDFMGWFAVMQHFGAPTRILDWSTSPWAALYFACQEGDETDGMLWIANFAEVTVYGEKQLANIGMNIGDFLKLIIDSNAPEILLFATSYNTNERIEAQQGRFSVCTNPLSDHASVLTYAKALYQIQIPLELKPFIMTELNQMNITAKTLFPGIDGLGRSIVEYCNLWDKRSFLK